MSSPSFPTSLSCGSDANGSVVGLGVESGSVVGLGVESGSDVGISFCVKKKEGIPIVLLDPETNPCTLQFLHWV